MVLDVAGELLRGDAQAGPDSLHNAHVGLVDHEIVHILQGHAAA